MIGKTLKNQYQIYDQIGEGSIAKVYVGRDTATNRIVAVKVIHPHLAAEGKFLEHFAHEARRIQQLSSEHVVEVYDFGMEGEACFIVLEFVQGWALSRLIKTHGVLGMEEALGICRQIALCLEEAEGNQIVHQDVRPANILVTWEGQAKLADYGITPSLLETGITLAEVGRSPDYMSPEQAEGQPLDIRTDVYSLGASLYEMLAGEPPYTGDSPVDIVMQHLRAPIPKVSDVREDASPELDALIAGCLAKKAPERFTPTELISAIEALLPPLPEAPRKRPVAPEAAVSETAILVSPSGREYIITGMVALIGRSDPRTGLRPDVDLSAEEYGRTVSRRHAFIKRSGTDWYIEANPRVRNPTLVNGEVVPREGQVLLQHGDVVQLGGVKLTFKLGAPEATA